MEILNGKDQKCRVILHQIPQAGFAQDHDYDVISTSSIIFWSWPCCDRKSWAACAQSFAPRQQATNRDHASQSLLLLLARATHIYFCSSRASGEVATAPASDCQFFKRKLVLELILLAQTLENCMA